MSGTVVNAAGYYFYLNTVYQLSAPRQNVFSLIKSLSLFKVKTEITYPDAGSIICQCRQHLHLLITPLPQIVPTYHSADTRGTQRREKKTANINKPFVFQHDPGDHPSQGCGRWNNTVPSPAPVLPCSPAPVRAK
ncbi:hypothetical protein BaRGS_00016155 [Batillaria attramentaria]|uniref:Uncharacterized protein n=1 Tax=Batillaria attramentaria TaxID=370345 RepID=A0ABD0KZZ9_9CAEN